MNKNNSGFSLVELIVVIAIMAILAGIAVPTYSKYIANAKDATVLAELDEIKTAATAAAAKKGMTVIKIVVTDADSDTILVTTSDNKTGTVSQADVLAFLDNASFEIDLSQAASFKTNKTATWEPSGTNANKWV